MWRRLAAGLIAGLRGFAGPVMDPSAVADDRELMARDVERFVRALSRGEIGADDFSR
jgi:hypothetical protein